MTRPVTPAILRKTSTCDSAFWPTVASSTSSTACGAVGVDLLHHAHDLFQLVHQLGAVLQPAGGVDRAARRSPSRLRRRSARRRRGRRRPRPARARSPCAPTRPPQILSCSIAAARNVSPAASITCWPSRGSLRRELADGRGLAGAVDADHQDDERLLRRRSTSGLATGVSTFSTSAARTALHLVVEIACRSGPRPSRSAICAATSTPRSARISASSISSMRSRRSSWRLHHEVGDRAAERAGACA